MNTVAMGHLTRKGPNGLWWRVTAEAGGGGLKSQRHPPTGCRCLALAVIARFNASVTSHLHQSSLGALCPISHTCVAFLTTGLSAVCAVT